MKKVAIIGANGKSGSALVVEALRQGYDVTGFARNKEYENGAIKLVHKDVFELSKADLAGFDIVISAVAAWTPQTFPLHAKMTQHIAELLSGTQTRLFVIGGAGVLYTDASRKTRLMDTPSFPAEYMGVAGATAASYEVLKASKNLIWTYVIPAAEYDANAARTGSYVLGGDELILNGKGKSYIGYADLALAVIDEIRAQKFISKPFTAVGE